MEQPVSGSNYSHNRVPSQGGGRVLGSMVGLVVRPGIRGWDSHVTVGCRHGAKVMAGAHPSRKFVTRAAEEVAVVILKI